MTKYNDITLTVGLFEYTWDGKNEFWGSRTLTAADHRDIDRNYDVDLEEHSWTEPNIHSWDEAIEAIRKQQIERAWTQMNRDEAYLEVCWHREGGV